MRTTLQTRLIGLVGLLTLTLLATTGYTYYNLLGTEDDARILAVIGGQRMLAQQMETRALAVSSYVKAEENRQLLLQGLETFRKALHGLLQGDADLQLAAVHESATIAALEEALKTWETMAPAYQSVTSAPIGTPDFQAAIETVTTQNPQLAQRLLEAAQTFESASRGKVTYLQIVLAIGALLALVLLVASWFFITRTITRPLRDITLEVTGASEHLYLASSQIMDSGHALAQSTSSQAASVDDTAASVKALTDMIGQNTERTTKADGLSREANDHAERGIEATRKLIDTIGEIKASSDETANIIKSIDQIAFQTNLLALNAAVEAARAGDSGRGFAVVADEVRNLAQRSAEAAQTTSALIASAHDKVQAGVAASGEVQAVLGDLQNAAREVSLLVREIADAGAEQSRGIDQISHAMAQVDQATQDGAATAQQTAAAGQELFAQAERLNGLLDRLSEMVGEGGRHHDHGAGEPLARAAALPAPEYGRGRQGAGRGGPSHGSGGGDDTREIDAASRWELDRQER